MGRHYALSFPQKLLWKSRQFPQHRGLPGRYGGKAQVVFRKLVKNEISSRGPSRAAASLRPC